MPERQTPWREVAAHVGGALQVQTGLKASSFRLQSHQGDLRILATGESVPYALYGGWTEIRVWSGPALGSLNLYRNHARVPMHRRFLWRDVIIGDAVFDTCWIIHAKREAHAQAYLSPQVRRLLDSVSPAILLGDTYSSHYNFDVRGHSSRARAPHFEQNTARFIAAIEAATALARRPEGLLRSFRELAVQLDGELYGGDRWKLDGSTAIHFATRGRPIRLSPIMVATGWRRDRLHTRISCEYASAPGHARLEFGPQSDVSSLVDPPGPATKALHDAAIVKVVGTSRRVYADLDGDVSDIDRIRAAAFLVASIARGTGTEAGPYR